MKGKRSYVKIAQGLMVGLLLLMLIGCGGGDGSTTLLNGEPPAAEGSYVGSKICGTCHQDISQKFQLTGHAYMLRTRQQAEQAPSLGLPDIATAAKAHFNGVNQFVIGNGTGTGVVATPTWDDIAWVVGGYRWKVELFLNKDGYPIWTGAKGGTQYTKSKFVMKDGTWASQTFDPNGDDAHGEYGRCLPCHTTGGVYDKTGATHPQYPGADLPGIWGTFDLPGIQCERCHGKASKHLSSSKEKLTVNTSADLCGECHNRTYSDSNVITSGGFIRHHEQYNEFKASLHYQNAKMDCVSCHDPHSRSDSSIKTSCENCHFKETYDFSSSKMAKNGVKCTDCHMARAIKSGWGDSATKEGDVMAHLFAISTDPNYSTVVNGAKNSTDGKNDVVPLVGGVGYIDLNFACLRCHVGKTKTNFSNSITNSGGNPHKLTTW